LSGGPASVYDPTAPKLHRDILGLDLPVLGLCYGHQLLAEIAGGKIESAEAREYGTAYVTIDKP
ncbi:MAG: glutamine-hydrolyzing GMP synthase, partial [Candidatus Korarchaeota archaeon]|nr:glutamine-hydrolyzing GMP synthase [Candidatus Korarchaeota archaeon]